LSQRLLAPDRRPGLVEALVRASQIDEVALHCNKGLAGAPSKVLGWTRDTAMNPAVLDAFALAIASANEPPAYPGIPGHEPDVAQGRRDARVVAAAMAPLKALAERPASYVSETDYFQEDWQAAFWGDHYARLSRVKDRYDPGGLFSVHHGVGTETCGANGRTNAPGDGAGPPAFSRYETYVGIVVDDPAAPDWPRSSAHRCAAAWIESDES
jgi:hypothetical protein